MADLINMSTILSIAAIVTAVGGAWLTVRKIAKDLERQKKLHTTEILQAAREADSSLRTKLEGRIHELEIDMKSIKENHQKDIAHMKETYNGELRFLGQKIEELRSEVRNQHGQLVQLLSKMIEKND